MRNEERSYIFYQLDHRIMRESRRKLRKSKTVSLNKVIVFAILIFNTFSLEHFPQIILAFSECLISRLFLPCSS